MIYFDNAATTKIDKEILNCMIPYLKNNYGNPSSAYSLGINNKIIMEKCRDVISNIFDCFPSEIYFTSGATESNNTLIKGIAYANKYKGNHIITSKIEHPSVLNTCKELEENGFEVTYLDVDKNGLIDFNQLKKSIKKNTILISIMFVNNEIGTIEPIKEIEKIVHKNNIIFHVDATQAIGKFLINLKELNIDAMSLSGHKIHAPKGIGLMYLKRNIKCNSLLKGGGQERNFRSGTENIPYIVGLTQALMNINKNLNNKNYLKINLDNKNKINIFMKYLLKYFDKEEYKINSNFEYGINEIINISFKNIDGEALKLYLNNKNIFVSNGSACHSGSISPSYVLTAIGVPNDYILGTLRISFGKNNNKKDFKILIKEIYNGIQLQKISKKA